MVTASESEHPDLLWGLRGGGNFGIVTEFTFRLHPVAPEAYGGLLMYPRSQAPEVLRHVRDVLNDAPQKVRGGVLCMHAPPAPFIPAELHGGPRCGRARGALGASPLSGLSDVSGLTVR